MSKQRYWYCNITGLPCHFSKELWECGGVRDIANDNYPIQSYQSGDKENRIDDWCKNLLRR